MDWVFGPGAEFNYSALNNWEIKGLESVVTVDSYYGKEAPESCKGLHERRMVKDMMSEWYRDQYESKHINEQFELHCLLLPNFDRSLNASDYMVKLYLGDTHAVPAGWTGCFDAGEAIEFLKAGLVVQVKLDFALKEEDCTAVLQWMDTSMKKEGFYPAEIECLPEAPSGGSDASKTLASLSDYKAKNIQALQSALALDRRLSVRLRLASDRLITEDSAYRLMEDKSYLVLSTLAGNPALSRSAQLKLVETKVRAQSGTGCFGW